MKPLLRQNTPEPDWGDEIGCVDGYPEHLFEFIEERDDVATYRCTRCDAEIWEEAS